MSAHKTFSTGILYFIGNVAQSAITVLLVPVYTHFLSPEDFGVISLIGISITLIIIFVSNPVLSAVIRFFYSPEYTQRKDELIFNLFMLMLIKAFLLFGLYLLFADTIIVMLLSAPVLLPLIKLYSLYIILQPVSDFFKLILRLKQKALAFVIINLLALITTVVIVCFLLYKDVGIYSLAYGGIAGFLITIFLASTEFTKTVKYNINFGLLRQPMSYAYPLLVSAYAQTLFQSSDRYLIKILDSVRSVGLYDFGYRIGGFLDLFFVKPVSLSLEPVILQKEKSPDELRLFIKTSTTHIYAVGVFLFLVISLFSNEVVRVFAYSNSDFWEAAVVIPWIAFGYLQHGIGSVFGWGIIFRNKSALFSAIMVAALTSNTLLNILLIPEYGIVGAAMATVLSYMFWNAMKIYYSNKHYQMQFELKRLVTLTLIGCALALAGAFFPQIPGMIVSFVLKIILLIFFPVILWTTNFFSTEEKNKISSFLFYFISRIIAAFRK